MLPRPGLVRAILDHLDRPLVSIVADAGYGKTTLLAEAIRAVHRPVLWYSLVGSDADPVVFARHVVAAFRREIPRFGRDLERLLEELGPGPVPGEKLGGVLSNELALLRGPEHVLVLDDFHEVAHEEGIVAMLDVVLRHPPPRFRLWIASRSTPTLALERLRAHRGAFELDSSRLAFGPGELSRLFADVFRRPLADAERDALLETTRGWPTAIHLVHQAMERRPGVPLAEVLREVGDAPREVQAYLSAEVLDRLSPDARRLLERTVPVVRIDPPLASRLSGLADVGPQLEELSHRGLLRSFGAGGHETYAWHDLVRHAVRAAVVARDGEDAWRGIERAAAEALRERGEPEAAFALAARAGSPALAVALARDLAPALLAQSRPGALLEVLQALPPAELEADASLRVSRADAHQALGRWDEAAADYRAVLDRAPAGVERVTLCRALIGLARVLNRRGSHEQALGMAERGLALGAEIPVDLRVRLLQTKAGAHFYLGQSATAVAILGEVRRLLAGTPHTDLLVPTTHNLALALVAQGRYDEAARELRGAIAAVRGTGSPRAGLYLANLATVLVEMGEYAEARLAAEEALDLARRFSNRMHETMALEALAESLAQSGDVEAALPALKRAEELNAELRMEVLSADLLALRGRIFSARGQYRRGVEYFARAAELVSRRPGAPRLTVFHARLAWCELRSGRLQAAHDLLVQSLPAADAGEDDDQRMRVHYWLAEALIALGRAPESVPHLRAALALVRERGYQHFLRGQARENPAPLAHALAAGLELEVCAAALAEAGSAAEAPVLGTLAGAPPEVAEAACAVLAEVGGPAALEALGRLALARRPLAAAAGIARRRIEERLQRGRSELEAAPRGRQQVRLRLFGPPSIEIEGRRVPGSAWRTRRAFHILVHLALHPRGAGRDELLETFWPGRQLASGRRNFHPTLSYLRTVLPRNGGGLLARDGEVYRLDPDYPLTCDLWEFEALLDEARRAGAEARREILGRALALADRPLLEGVYEDWADAAQTRVRDRVEQAWIELGALEARAGRHDAALAAARRAAELDPFRETTRVAIVEQLVRVGNRAAALVEAGRLREQLRDELGVEPLPETEHALREALGTAEPAAPPRRAQPPADAR